MAKIIKKHKSMPVNTVYKMRINCFFLSKSSSNYYRQFPMTILSFKRKHIFIKDHLIQIKFKKNYFYITNKKMDSKKNNAVIHLRIRLKLNLGINLSYDPMKRKRI
ncbi:hypothetical protein AAZX31_18G159700 [Glycine max]